ncbi:hypothetical protein A7C99_3352 [Trichophyton rubrum]|uniref:Wax synthase domain-containing protein n=1 Tax=Trichophyton rubrum TaxID=5551 RepID=A0A178F250_TRIRU|nr:hypothetical protein A7C99_3352 [Trichophyton rubrum]
MEIHPILLGGAVVASSALAVGFTRPSSISRQAVAPILTFCTFRCIATSMDYMIRCPWAGLVGAYTITFFLHYLDIVLLRGWSFEAGGPSTDPGTGKNIPNYPKKGRTDNTWERLKFGLAATCSFRHIGTPYQVRNVPWFSDKDPEVFWQQTNAAKFASVSSFIVQRVLRISRGTQLYRYARLVTIFAVSALMHVLVDVASGLSLTSSGAARFFLTQAFGIIIEDIVVSIYYNFMVKDRSRGSYLLEKCVGFVWVCAFMIWSSPAYVYPLMYRVNSGQDDSIIPFSIIKMLIPDR